MPLKSSAFRGRIGLQPPLIDNHSYEQVISATYCAVDFATESNSLTT